MPELPEVETIKRQLEAAGIVGQKIERAEVFWPRTIHQLGVAEFCKKIQGQLICKLDRKGKWILFHLSEDLLFVHLRMTGKFVLSTDRSSHERVRLQLSGGKSLHYVDTRKFGRWYLVKEMSAITEKLGIEPLSHSFTVEALMERIKGRATSTKSFLLNQSIIAGLGNIYVDEALWEAAIHPMERVDRLKEQQIRDLRQAIRKVLQRGLEHGGTSLGDGKPNYVGLHGERGGHQHQLRVYRQEGRPCSRCSTLIVKQTIAQRGTHFCPTCQKSEARQCL